MTTEWKLVPVEPTNEMVNALKARITTTSRGGLLGAGAALAKAICAAPVPPAGGEVEVFTAIDELSEEAGGNGNSWHTWVQPRAGLVKRYVTHLTAERNALKAEVAHLRQHKNDYMEAAEETRNALQSELTKARELLQEVAEEDADKYLIGSSWHERLAHQSAPAAKGESYE